MTQFTDNAVYSMIENELDSGSAEYLVEESVQSLPSTREGCVPRKFAVLGRKVRLSMLGVAYSSWLGSEGPWRGTVRTGRQVAVPGLDHGRVAEWIDDVVKTAQDGEG